MLERAKMKLSELVGALSALLDSQRARCRWRRSAFRRCCSICEKRYPDAARNTAGRPARRLAGPLVPRAREPDRADRARHLRAARRTRRAALFDEVMDSCGGTAACSREHLLKIGVSGIRGVVGEFLTPALAAAVRAGVRDLRRAGRVVVGRDTRAAGEMLQHAVTCGLLAAGCEVVEVGILPTPTIQVYVAETRARGGIALTASHNPPEYNALKLFNAEGLFFNHYERERTARPVPPERFPPGHQRRDPQGTDRLRVRARACTSRRVLKHVDVERIRGSRFRVALDAVNGAGSVMSRAASCARTLGCELDAIRVDPTKPFPREAEPRPESAGRPARLVLRASAHRSASRRIRMATGWRCATKPAACWTTTTCWRWRWIARCGRMPGDVVVNLTTSSVIDDIAARTAARLPHAGGRSERGRDDAGGERGDRRRRLERRHHLPGGSLLPRRYTGMAFLLDRMAETGKTVSELAGQLPRYYRQLGKVPFEHGRLGPMMQALEEAFRPRRIGPHRRAEADVGRTAGSTCARRTRNRCCAFPWKRGRPSASRKYGVR